LSTIEDYLELTTKRHTDYEVFVLRLALTLAQTAPRFLPESIKHDVLRAVKEEMRNTFIRRVLQLCFRYLEKHKLRNVKLLDCDVVMTTQINEDLIILHPKTLCRAFNAHKELFKEVRKDAKEEV